MRFWFKKTPTNRLYLQLNPLSSFWDNLLEKEQSMYWITDDKCEPVKRIPLHQYDKKYEALLAKKVK